jgi:pimeloyl-ACP methyl ester carboxylesterase
MIVRRVRVMPANFVGIATRVVVLGGWILLTVSGLLAQKPLEEVRRSLVGDAQTTELDRRTIYFNEEEREYFVRLPRGLDSDRTYWLLVGVHGGGGNGAGRVAGSIGLWTNRLGLDAIVVTPTFDQEDADAGRFPSLGEDEFLKSIITGLRQQYLLREQILLFGYSRGGQFSHRFALQNPELVRACAPLAAGTWTTPDGRFLVDGVGEVKDPRAYVISTNAEQVGENQRTFSSRVVSVADLPAKPGAEKIPFLVMCGTLDTRIEIARAFAATLEAEGYKVQTEWPRTPHSPTEDFPMAEWDVFFRRATEFFIEVTRGE